jgi:hypothetical protein
MVVFVWFVVEGRGMVVWLCLYGFLVMAELLNGCFGLVRW